jgi:hypothetical protein
MRRPTVSRRVVFMVASLKKVQGDPSKAVNKIRGLSGRPFHSLTPYAADFEWRFTP